MKQTKKLFSLSSLLFIATLVSCGGGKTESTTEDVTPVTSKFSTAVDGTVSATYVAEFKVDIDTNGGTANLDSFKRDIKSTTTIDIDFTSSSRYLKVTSTTQDKLNNTTTKREALVFQADSKYYYETNRTAAAVEITTDVSAKVEELIAWASSTQVGGITAGTFLYKTDKSYELDQFSLTTTFEAMDLEDPAYSLNDKGGIKVEYAPTYVGYQTDNGISDFKNIQTNGAAAANVVLNTNEKGYVLDYTETYVDTGMDMPIMTPAPTVKVSGSRTFTATYGGELTKATSIDLNTDTAYVTISRDTNVASVSAKEFVLEGQTPGAMSDVSIKNNEAETKTATNKWLALTPKCISGYKVKSVKVNGKDAMYMAGFYCFSISNPGEFDVVVESEADTGATVEYVEFTTTKGEHVSDITVAYIIAPNYSTVMNFTDGKATYTDGFFFAIKATFDEGYTYDAVKVGEDVVTLVQGGYYCSSVKKAGTYAISVTAKASA